MTLADSRTRPAGTDSLPGPRARVGFFVIGLDTYCPQFEGLK